MSTTKQHQFEMENKSWARSLEFLKQENALLKYRLSEIVDSNEGDGILAMAEYFQTEFVSKDEETNKLAALVRRSSEELFESNGTETLPAALIKRQDTLRTRISLLQKSFVQLALDFNKQMLKTVS